MIFFLYEIICTETKVVSNIGGLFMIDHATHIKAKESRKESILTVFKIALMVIVIVPIIALLFGTKEIKNDASMILSGLFSDSSIEEPSLEKDDWSIDSNLDTLKCLKPEIWNELSYQEKYDVMCKIKNIEMYNSGISMTSVYPELVAESLPCGTQGICCYNLNQIKIDSSHLAYASARSVLNTICHEVRHWEQFTYKKLFEETNPEYQNLAIFETTKEYIDNLNNYVDTLNSDGENFDEYYNQVIEVDAREHAEKEVEFYYDIIDRYRL